MFACSGILFNQNRTSRQRICDKENYQRCSKNSCGQQEVLELGNLMPKETGGMLKIMLSMWLMLQQDEPDDYVIATGETYG